MAAHAVLTNFDRQNDDLLSTIALGYWTLKLVIGDEHRQSLFRNLGPTAHYHGPHDWLSTLNRQFLSTLRLSFPQAVSHRERDDEDKKMLKNALISNERSLDSDPSNTRAESASLKDFAAWIKTYVDREHLENWDRFGHNPTRDYHIAPSRLLSLTSIQICQVFLAVLGVICVSNLFDNLEQELNSSSDFRAVNLGHHQTLLSYDDSWLKHFLDKENYFLDLVERDNFQSYFSLTTRQARRAFNRQWTQ
ncbi:hypothetical protein OIO90_004301 [Microbotryomycetes sp. JL221]|nr:hypothetical protein OIO90_004301 [Microbotryomycetes sp. JL221]